jgi:hypothetical protein
MSTDSARQEPLELMAVTSLGSFLGGSDDDDDVMTTIVEVVRVLLVAVT